MELQAVQSRLYRVMEKHLAGDIDEIRVSSLPKRDQAIFWRRQTEFHPSSAPICPLRLAYTKFTLGSDPVIQTNFAGDYYLNVGTIAHRYLQYWLGKSGKIVGNWTCSTCSPKVAYRFSTKPSSCRECKGSDFDYHEVGGKDDNVHWHADGLFKCEDEYWLIDYKTTSSYQIEQHRKTRNVFPYYSNLFQIETYIPLIERKYNIKVAGYFLIYLSRDKPNNIKYGIEIVGVKLSSIIREKLYERLDRFKKAHELASQVLQFPAKVFQKAIKTKLCPDLETYTTKIKGYNPCPFEDVCFLPKTLTAHVKKVLQEGPAK